jgi:hypothetical protein
MTLLAHAAVNPDVLIPPSAEKSLFEMLVRRRGWFRQLPVTPVTSDKEFMDVMEGAAMAVARTHDPRTGIGLYPHHTDHTSSSQVFEVNSFASWRLRK